MQKLDMTFGESWRSVLIPMFSCSLPQVVFFVLRATDTPFIPHDAPLHTVPHTVSPTHPYHTVLPSTYTCHKVPLQSCTWRHKTGYGAPSQTTHRSSSHRAASPQRSGVLTTSSRRHPQTPGAQSSESDVRPKETRSLSDPTAHHPHPPALEMLSGRA